MENKTVINIEMVIDYIEHLSLIHISWTVLSPPVTQQLFMTVPET